MWLGSQEISKCVENSKSGQILTWHSPFSGRTTNRFAIYRGGDMERYLILKEVPLCYAPSPPVPIVAKN